MVAVPSANWAPCSGPNPRYTAVSTRQDVGVREQQRVAGLRRAAREDPPGAVGDLLGGLPAGRVAVPDRPARHLDADLGGGEALVVAVLPLGEVVVDLGVGVAGEPRRLAGPLARAGEDEREIVGVEPGPERAGVVDAARQQRHVGATGVPPGLAPLGRAVADQPHLGGRAGHVRKRR